MKVTITYKTSSQISPDSFKEYTEVMHLKENDTVKDIYERICNKLYGKSTGAVRCHDFDGEIHFKSGGQ